jgi:hypothetical protein
MRKSVLTTLAVCAAIVGALAVPAAAPAANIPTTVSIRFVDRTGPDIFRGRVTSPNANCIQDRTVRLFRARAGDDQLIDTDSSEDNGSWSIDVEGDPTPGRYYVRVTRRALGADSCAPARSPVIDVAG